MNNTSSKIADDYELMQFAVKGSDEDWKKALKDQEVGPTGVVQIQSNAAGKVKRKLNQEDIDKEAGIAPKRPLIKKKRQKKSKRK